MAEFIQKFSEAATDLLLLNKIYIGSEKFNNYLIN